MNYLAGQLMRVACSAILIWVGFFTATLCAQGQPISLGDVLTMVKDGVPAEIVILVIEETGTHFALTEAERLALAKKGVPTSVVNALTVVRSQARLPSLNPSPEAAPLPRSDSLPAATASGRDGDQQSKVPTSPQAPVPTGAMTNGDVINLLQAGIGPGTVERAVRNAPEVAFEVDAKALVALKRQGVPDALLNAIIDRASGTVLRAGCPPPCASTSVPPVPGDAVAAKDPEVPLDAPARRFSVLIRHGWGPADGVLTVGHDHIELKSAGNNRAEFSETISSIEIKKRQEILDVRARNGKSFTLFEGGHPLKKALPTGDAIEETGLSEIAQAIENAKAGKPLFALGPETAIRVFVSGQRRSEFTDSTKDMTGSVQDVQRGLQRGGLFTLVSSPTGADVVLEVIGRREGVDKPGSTVMVSGNPVTMPATRELSLRADIVIGEYRKELTASGEGGVFGITWSGLADRLSKDFAAWCVANRERLLAGRTSRGGR